MEKSVTLIKDFVNLHLEGNIEDIDTFDFMKLEGEEKYDGCPKGDFDPDDSKLAKAIYYVIWKDELPKLDSIEDIGRGKTYRGDTLNTFTTLFGKRENGENFYSRAQKFCSGNDDDFKELVNKFHSKYLTIGNFMILPNLLPLGEKNINMHRGNWYKWCDFFDRFLLELKYCLTNDEKQDKIFKKLINENNFYFKDIFNNNIQEFSKVNFLEKYFTADGEVELFFEPHYFPRIFATIKNPTDGQKEEYKEYARKYIAKTAEIIDYRANKIIDKLKLEIKK